MSILSSYQKKAQEVDKVFTFEPILSSVIRTHKGRKSRWERGVFMYAEELLYKWADDCEYNENLITDILDLNKIHELLLNGASNWHDYSWGGCSLIYDRDIANRVCTISELKKTDNGNKRPNKREEWLDVQARALYQAERLIKESIRNLLLSDMYGRN